MFCHDDGTETRINLCSPNAETPEASIMQLGKDIFEMDFLGYIPLESKSGLFSGVAYILPHEVSLHAKTSHRIYLKNMLLTEDGEAILPKWSGFLKCFLNTSQLRPTASRENFYEDELLAQAREEISSCISDWMKKLAGRDPYLLEQIIQIHFMAIKSMACEDETFFQTFIPYLKFETNFGQRTGKELLTRTTPVSYALDNNQFHRTSALMLAQNQLLVNACYVYDAQLLHMMQEYDSSFSAVPLAYMTFEEYLHEADPEFYRSAKPLLQTAQSVLQEFDCDAELKSFSPETLPVFYMLDENAQIKREIQHSQENGHALFSSMLEAFAAEVHESKAVLFLNAENPLIQKLATLHNQKRQEICIEILYIQSLLTGRFPMQGGEMNLLNQDLITMLEWGLS